MRILAALQFLTTFPIKRNFTLDDIGGSIGLFPLVGLIIGSVLAVISIGLGPFLPDIAMAGLLLLASVAMTGALHLDGFIDTCDGLAGHRTVEERLRIMRDSCAGGIGVVCTVVLLILKFSLLAAFTPAARTAAVLVMPVVSRWGMAYALWRYPAVRKEGLGKQFKDYATPVSCITATILAVAIAVIVLSETGMVVIAGVLALVIITAHAVIRVLGGLTGDVYGAINEIAEVGVLFIVLLLV